MKGAFGRLTNRLVHHRDCLGVIAGVLVAAGLVATPGAAAQDPPDFILATQPVQSTQMISAGPALSQAQVMSALADLNSPDENLQWAAREKLMGLSREQLPLLRACVQRQEPISPSMAALLHEVVVQVYLADDPYPCDPRAGFLGLRWADAFELEDAPRLGVPVGVRLPGFPSYRVLQTGDLILGVLQRPDLPLEQLPNQVTASLNQLKAAVSRVTPGQEVVLDILRQGQRLRIPLKLNPQLLLPLEQVEPYCDQRVEKAQTYWRDTFLPLIQPGMS